MKQSLLKRLLLTIFIILLGIFITGQIIGSVIIKSWFLKEQLKEMTPQMQEAAKEIRVNKGSISITGRSQFIIKAYDINKKEIPVVGTNDKPPLGINNGKKLFTDDEIRSDLLVFMDKALAGNMVTTITTLKHIKNKSMIVGLPIINNGKILGTIFTIKLADDYDFILNGFYLVFFCTSFISIIIILLLIYYFVRKLIKPLTEMAEVANSMADGNFEAHAKEEGYGEIKKLSISLNNLADRLFEKDNSAKLLEKTRRDYIANVSHELRTPISSIRAISETLSDNLELNIDKKHKYYLIILRESKRLQKLINDMLELSRLQSGEMAISKSMVSGKKIISEIVEYFDIFAEDTGIKFLLSESLDYIPDFYSNESRISQILFILLDNAFKFAKVEGYVKLDAVWDEEIITISVENTGEGISKEDIQFVFERFYKGDKSHNQNGSGLGLSIAKEIIRNLGEEIFVSSVYGEKTRFEFTLHRNL
jgi:signal transduction histidine kinase